MLFINKRRSHTATIILNQGRNEPKNKDSVYISKVNQRAQSNDKNNIENKNQSSNVWISYISNYINNNKFFDVGKNDNKNEF